MWLSGQPDFFSKKKPRKTWAVGLQDLWTPKDLGGLVKEHGARRYGVVPHSFQQVCVCVFFRHQPFVKREAVEYLFEYVYWRN